MFLFVVLIFGKQQYQIFSDQTSVPKMAEWTEEFKGFTPPHVPTTSASTTQLPLGSLDLITRVPDTGTATPSRRRLQSHKGRRVWLQKGQGTHREQKDSACLMLTKDVHGELGNSSRQTQMQRRRRRRLYRLSMKKRPDELVITALQYDVLN